MKKVGMTAGGTCIVEMNGSEVEFLGKIVAVFDTAPRIEKPIGSDGAALMETPLAPVKPKKTGTKRVKTGTVQKAPPLAPRTCEDCGKQYQPRRKDQRYCKRCSKMTWHGAKPKTTPAVAVPPKVDRLALIRQAARNVEASAEHNEA